MDAPRPVPDVTVVVPVYNTMPYLTACLDSLLRQTIGTDRLEVIAVDDGSTDGSGDLLDRYAEKHPDVFTVLHQENSGGPASPCNRGIDAATGRFVFFLGADDYLGDEALQRLVEKADEWESDVIFGRMVGVGGRMVSQTIFEETSADLDFLSSRLAYAVSNTKLFRRSLIEDRSLRYGLDLRVGSDQPFAIEAMLHARRVSVLADYTYYYAVRRDDAQNISYTTAWRARLEDIGNVMHHVASLLEPGATRDVILLRHFDYELSKLLLGGGFLELHADDQAALCHGFARLADAYLTDGIRDRLSIGQRVRTGLAQAGRPELLRTVITHQKSGEVTPLLVEGEQVYLCLPGFRDPQAGIPDEWFAYPLGSIRERIRTALRSPEVTWRGRHLEILARIELHAGSAPNVSAMLVPVVRRDGIPPFRRFPRQESPGGVEAPVSLSDEGGSWSRLSARIDLAPLFADPARPGKRWAVRVYVHGGAWTYDLPVIVGTTAVTRVRVVTRFFALRAGHDKRKRLFVTRRRVPLGEMLRDTLGRKTKK